ncbi:BON domain-containing protein [Candidatus Nitrosacidococcus tergens]|uniref:BON domain-containing protein n=1 Tax=Candidatus Nitrosacidococcus tergens TaxID=553981 RepID=A0A7G1QAV8_9GAMM|nr:BON domain-containing protein [Candidatus Nitrosacidococcus tergens]CAB1276962.1 exported protein of unknown function [Candidatus Nitrosacidococcus tergens]
MNFCSTLLIYVLLIQNPTHALTNSQRTTPVIDHRAVEKAVETAIRNDPILDKNIHIQITNYGHTLLLTGEAANELLKERIFNIAKTTPSIEVIYDEIAVIPPITFINRIKDTWLTQKINIKMALQKEIDLSQVRIITARRIVYLFGFLTPQESKLMITLISHTRGVHKIVKILDI